MSYKYKKIVIEFCYYDKNTDRDIYSVKVLDNQDTVVSESYMTDGFVKTEIARLIG